MSGRLLLDSESSASANMAIDESLLRHAQAPVLRIYGWEQPCVSIGYFQKASVVAAGTSFVRRYTGGGLVEHGRDLTYTLVLPADHPLTAAGTLPSYRAIHEGVASTLRAAGVDCQLATAQPRTDHASCFLKPVPADVLDSKGAKLAGAAQRRTKQGCLHQGSILLSSQIPPQLPKILPDHLARALQTSWALTERTRQEEELAEKLFRDRYSTRDWNHCR
jgi:lipoate-protein ligase A